MDGRRRASVAAARKGRQPRARVRRTGVLLGTRLALSCLAAPRRPDCRGQLPRAALDALVAGVERFHSPTIRIRNLACVDRFWIEIAQQDDAPRITAELPAHLSELSRLHDD